MDVYVMACLYIYIYIYISIILFEVSLNHIILILNM